MLDLSRFNGFEWDNGNDTKNWDRHEVTNEECEQVFFNHPLLLLFDRRHSVHEERYYAYGKTDADRFLLVVFTPRRDLIRIVSARDMTARERRRCHAP